MAKTKTRKLDPNDVVRLGADVAQAKSSMSKKTWSTLVKSAHAKGLTVRGGLSSGPDILKERLRSSLEAEAKKNTATAYAPAVKELDDREASIKAVDTMRARDEASFREWLGQKQASLASDARRADAELTTRLGQINQDALNAWQQRQTQAVQTAQAAPGTVSDPAQSTALQQLAAAAQHSNEQQAATSTQAVQQSGNALSQMNVAGAAMLAATAANTAKRQAQTSQDLTKVTDDRTTLKLKQAADQATSLQDLLTQEATKAQSGIETQIAADKLNVDLQELGFKKDQFATQTKLATKKFNLDKWIAQNKLVTDQAKVDLGYDQIAASKGKAQADRDLKTMLERYRQGKLDKRQKARLDAAAEQDTTEEKKGLTPAQQKDQQTQFKTITTIRRQLEGLHDKYGDSGKTKGGKKFRDVMLGREYDDASISLAEDLRRNNGKLSPHGVSIAKRLGFTNPAAYFKIA